MVRSGINGLSCNCHAADMQLTCGISIVLYGDRLIPSWMFTMLIDTNTASSSDDSNLETGARPVIVAIDLLPGSEQQIIWACRYAGSISTRVIVLHIVHDSGFAPGFYHDGNHGNKHEPLHIVAERMVHSLLDGMRHAHADLTLPDPSDTVVVSGLPGARITEIAGLKDAQLIVIGHRRRNGIRSLLEGSVAVQLIKNIETPVVIIKD